MSKYAITRQVNNKEYYLENMYSDKVIWVTNKKEALIFEDLKDLQDLLNNEFPGKKYYPKEIIKTSLIHIP